MHRPRHGLLSASVALIVLVSARAPADPGEDPRPVVRVSADLLAVPRVAQRIESELMQKRAASKSAADLVRNRAQRALSDALPMYVFVPGDPSDTEPTLTVRLRDDVGSAPWPLGAVRMSLHLAVHGHPVHDAEAGLVLQPETDVDRVIIDGEELIKDKVREAILTWDDRVAALFASIPIPAHIEAQRGKDDKDVLVSDRSYAQLGQLSKGEAAFTVEMKEPLDRQVFISCGDQKVWGPLAQSASVPCPPAGAGGIVPRLPAPPPPNGWDRIYLARYRR